MFFKLNIVDLQSCVNLRCIAKLFRDQFSSVAQSCPTLCERYSEIDILFQILLHYRLLPDIEYSSLYYTVGLCLSFLYMK